MVAAQQAYSRISMQIPCAGGTNGCGRGSGASDAFGACGSDATGDAQTTQGRSLKMPYLMG